MISERVRAALEADLDDALRQVDAMGLMVMAGEGRVSAGDLRVEVSPPAAPIECKASQAKAKKAASKARAAKPAGKAPLALPSPAKVKAGGDLECCEVCGIGLTMCRGPKREFPLCAKHAGRWWQHRNSSGSDAMAFGAWVEHQKNGGGRRKKA